MFEIHENKNMFLKEIGFFSKIHVTMKVMTLRECKKKTLLGNSVIKIKFLFPAIIRERVSFGQERAVVFVSLVFFFFNFSYCSSILYKLNRYNLCIKIRSVSSTLKIKMKSHIIEERT